MHFAIIWNHPEITLRELQSIQLHNLQKIWNQILIFDTHEAEKLPHIASIIKRGEILPFSEIEKLLTHCHCEPEKLSVRRRGNPVNKARVLWIADKNTWIQFKKKYKIKRFKQVDLLHTDMEVKNKGIELIRIPPVRLGLGAPDGDTPKGRGGEYGVVQWYQNIKLYEIIDFDKPARSMQVGMMPAKLTHTLINIGLSLPPFGFSPPRGEGAEGGRGVGGRGVLIFDPFCWTWTTGLLANALGYHFIGSDIKPNLALKNAERRQTSSGGLPLPGEGARRADGVDGRAVGFYVPDKLFQFHEQDISKPLTEQFNILKDYQTVIVTEGRLGPVIKQTTTPEQIKEYQRRVKNLYLQFIQTITDFFPKDQRPPMVFTIPEYTTLGSPLIGEMPKAEGFIEEQISLLASQLWRNMETINEIYKRENQKVWRKIVILK